eukprot:78678_1
MNYQIKMQLIIILQILGLIYVNGAGDKELSYLDRIQRDIRQLRNENAEYKLFGDSDAAATPIVSSVQQTHTEMEMSEHQMDFTVSARSIVSNSAATVHVSQSHNDIEQIGKKMDEMAANARQKKKEKQWDQAANTATHAINIVKYAKTLVDGNQTWEEEVATCSKLTSTTLKAIAVYVPQFKLISAVFDGVGKSIGIMPEEFDAESAFKQIQTQIEQGLKDIQMTIRDESNRIINKMEALHATHAFFKSEQKLKKSVHKLKNHGRILDAHKRKIERTIGYGDFEGSIWYYALQQNYEALNLEYGKLFDGMESFCRTCDSVVRLCTGPDSSDVLATHEIFEAKSNAEKDAYFMDYGEYLMKNVEVISQEMEIYGFYAAAFWFRQSISTELCNYSRERAILDLRVSMKKHIETAKDNIETASVCFCDQLQKLEKDTHENLLILQYIYYHPNSNLIEILLEANKKILSKLHTKYNLIKTGSAPLIDKLLSTNIIRIKSCKNGLFWGYGKNEVTYGRNKFGGTPLILGKKSMGGLNDTFKVEILTQITEYNVTKPIKHLISFQTGHNQWVSDSEPNPNNNSNMFQTTNSNGITQTETFMLIANNDGTYSFRTMKQSKIISINDSGYNLIAKSSDWYDH